VPESSPPNGSFFHPTISDSGSDGDTPGHSDAVSHISGIRSSTHSFATTQLDEAKLPNGNVGSNTDTVIEGRNPSSANIAYSTTEMVASSDQGKINIATQVDSW
jgi:hypothetical protein